jgi:aminoglycoside/choline kinase family phosphotransferase
VQCDEHGVVVAHVPWARPGAKHTWAFEDTCAWLAAHTALSVLTVFLRIAWRKRKLRSRQYNDHTPVLFVYRSRAIGNRVHCAPISARHGGRHSTIVR